MNDKNYCVILAGGIGLKLWPSSTIQCPKQFIDFLGRGETLIQSTYNRIARFVPKENIIVTTNEQYVHFVREQLPELSERNLLVEPMRRNTLPSATWATVEISHRESDAQVLVVPSDQMIYDEALFQEEVMSAFNYVSKYDRILSLSVFPSRAETNYGYVQMGESVYNGFYHVKSFTEKPELEFAKLFVDNREFLWNTGMFLWSTRTFMAVANEMKAQLPMIDKAEDLLKHGIELDDIVKRAFSMCPNVSIEEACLDKHDNTDVMLCHFGWNDLGTWQTLFNAAPKSDGNVVMQGEAMLYDCNECIVKVPGDKVVVAQGLNDYVIAEENNILMICRKDDPKAIRMFVNDLQLKSVSKFKV